MASGWTNRGLYWLLNLAFLNAAEPTDLYVALVVDTPTFDTNVMSDLTEAASGNGYAPGGCQLSRSASHFDTITEDDSNDWSFVEVIDVVWTASGGTIPASGSGARYAVLTDDNGTVADREIYAYADLVSARSVADTKALTLQDVTFRLQHP